VPQFLTLQDIFETHAEQIAAYGGSEGLRDAALLESAIAQPQATFDGEFLHADLFEMSAAYLYHLVQNHPFLDGNKRVGLEAALVFLEVNGVSIETTD
jgi:death-on-curing protein